MELLTRPPPHDELRRLSEPAAIEHMSACPCGWPAEVLTVPGLYFLTLGRSACTVVVAALSTIVFCPPLRGVAT